VCYPLIYAASAVGGRRVSGIVSVERTANGSEAHAQLGAAIGCIKIRCNLCTQGMILRGFAEVFAERMFQALSGKMLCTCVKKLSLSR
jgi:hypothetical protein